HIKEGAADNATSNGARLTEANHREAHGGEIAERAQGFYAGLQVLDLGYGKRGVVVLDAGGALPDVDQPSLVAVDQRLEEDPAHQREDGGVGADAQGQREDHGERKPLRPQERVEGNSQVTKQ